MQYTETITPFGIDVMIGLTSTPKFLSSKYFYDEKGSLIYEKLTQLPDYYIKRCELEIFSLHRKALSELICKEYKTFTLVDLVSGHSSKTKILIKQLLSDNIDFTFSPVDSSSQSLEKLCYGIKRKYPDIKIKALKRDNFDVIENLNHSNQQPRVILFLGSEIGKYSWHQSKEFLKQMSSKMSGRDKLLIGLDLKKDPGLIISAQIDHFGYTEELNLNLLCRMNRELNANFNINNFTYAPVYNPHTGESRSYIVSKTEQDVFLANLNLSIYIEQWETILTEISQKYDLKMIHELAGESGLKVLKNFYDSKQYFVNTLFSKK